MKKQGKTSWLKHLDFMVIDTLSLLVSFIIAYTNKFHTFGFTSDSMWSSLLITMLMLNIIISMFMNPYSGIMRRRYYEDIYIFFLVTLYNFVLMGVLFYLLKVGAEYSRGVVFLTYIVFYFLSNIVKYIWKQLVYRRAVSIFMTRPTDIMLFCNLENAEETITNILASDLELYKVVGIGIPEDGTGICDVKGIPIVGGIEEFTSYTLEHGIKEVFIDVKPGELPKQCYMTLINNSVIVHLNIEHMIGFDTELQKIGKIGVYRTLKIDTFSLSMRQHMYLVLKRGLDIIIGILGCLLLLPIMAVIKIVNLSSGDRAPLIYSHTRVGLKGKEFKIYKFRSMVPDADEILTEMLKEEKWRTEWAENQKFENDPRVTKIGRILRKTSIDEVPQFINILKGDMSLVGPRPLIPGELEEHNGLPLYNKVKPGITGWWGCNGRSNIEYKERLELEYYYVKNCSLALDAICIFRTFFAVLKKDGAK